MGREPKPKKAAAATKRPRKKKAPTAAPRSKGLDASEVASSSPPASVETLVRAVEADGAAVIGRYREPFSGHWLLVAALPIEQVEPTPFQRDASAPHVQKLADVLVKCGRYLDPIVAMRTGERAYWTPNGNHRLQAMKKLGAKSIVALVVPEREVAFQILALNTEKAHNLREKSLEVIRMYRTLAKEDPRPEKEHSLAFDEPYFATLGLCYEQRPRFSGGAYQSVLKRVDFFLDDDLGEALGRREERAALLLSLDDEVARIVAALKERGLTSPYLKAFAMARINNFRFVKGDLPPFEEAIESLVAKAKKFNIAKVNQQDIAASGGPPDEE